MGNLVWNGKRGVENVECQVWRVKCGVNVECKCVKYKVSSVKCSVKSVECKCVKYKVSSVKCRV